MSDRKYANVYLRTRYYGGSYIARVYEPRLSIQATSTASEESAARAAAMKCAGGATLEKLVRLGADRWRATFADPPAAKSADSPVTWHDARIELPDDELTVLVALADGEVWPGFRDAGQWRYVSADAIEMEVRWWAEFPAPPNAEVSERRAADVTTKTGDAPGASLD